MSLTFSFFTQQNIRAIALAVLTGSAVAGCGASNQKSTNTQTQSKTASEQYLSQSALENQHSQASQTKAREEVSDSSLQKAELITVTGSRTKEPLMEMADISMPAKHAMNNAVRMIRPAPQNQPATLGENYQKYPENGVWTVAQQPFSTFSVDVDTASYSNVRRMLNRGIIPPKGAVRVEEFINYFNYDYAQPNARDGKSAYPFNVDVSLTDSPYNSDRHLMRVALSGKDIDDASRAESNLVFLLDVSGSMNSDDKLPLLKRALNLMLTKLDKRDSVSIVVYAGSTGVVLEPTSGDDKFTISQALENLQAGGSTDGASGIQLAYKMAQKAFKKEGVNRVILATDGDFNVGITDQEDLMELIAKQRDTGIFLSVLGFGAGNYNDHLTEQLADKGNGNAAYIDNINEARKVLVEQLTGTLQVIAKDVKIQVEFNPEVVHEYRLIGYENRVLNKEDFNNDKVDAGDIGAGHKVTAFYEVTLNSASQYTVDHGRYQMPKNPQNSANNDEVAFVKLRYKAPDSDISQLHTSVLTLAQMRNFKDASDEYHFASAVAGLAQLLGNSKFVDKAQVREFIELARSSKGEDREGYRTEFIKMMATWQLLAQRQHHAPKKKVDKLHRKPLPQLDLLIK